MCECATANLRVTAAKPSKVTLYSCDSFLSRLPASLFLQQDRHVAPQGITIDLTCCRFARRKRALADQVS